MSATTGMLRSALGYAPWAVGLVLIGVGIGFGRDKWREHDAEENLEVAWGELENCLVGPSRGYESDPEERFRLIAMNPNSAGNHASPNGWPTRCRVRAERVVSALQLLPRNADRDALRGSVEAALPRFGGLELHEDIAPMIGHARALELEDRWTGAGAPAPYSGSEPPLLPGRLRVPVENVVRLHHSIMLDGDVPRFCKVYDHSPTLDCMPMAKGVLPSDAEAIVHQSDHTDAFAKWSLIVPSDKGYAVVDVATGERLAENVERESVFIPSIAPDAPRPIHFLRRKEERRPDYELVRSLGSDEVVLKASFAGKGEVLETSDAVSNTPHLVGEWLLSSTDKGWGVQLVSPFWKKREVVLPLSGDVRPRLGQIAHACVQGADTIVLTGTNAAPLVLFERRGKWQTREAGPWDLFPGDGSGARKATFRCRENVLDITWLERVPQNAGDRYPAVVPMRLMCERDGCGVSKGEPVVLYGAGPLTAKGDDARLREDDATLVGLVDGNMLLVWRTPLVGVRARVGQLGRLQLASEQVLSQRTVTSLHTFGSGEHVTVLFSDDQATSGVRVSSSGLIVQLTESSRSMKLPE